MSNPFQQADPWEVSLDSLLPAGNYVCTIEEAATGWSRNGYFQIELKLTNAQGTIRDWMVVTENSVGKVVALANATKVDLPTDADITDTAKLTLSDEYVYRFAGKTVGVVVRDEQDFKDPTQMRPRVQGYVDPSRIKESSDVTSPASAGSFRTPPNNAKQDVEVPF
jgi:hypothetical protein